MRTSSISLSSSSRRNGSRFRRQHAASRFLEAIDRDFDERGLVDDEGTPRYLLNHRSRISRQLEQWLHKVSSAIERNPASETAPARADLPDYVRALQEIALGHDTTATARDWLAALKELLQLERRGTSSYIEASSAEDPEVQRRWARVHRADELQRLQSLEEVRHHRVRPAAGVAPRRAVRWWDPEPLRHCLLPRKLHLRDRVVVVRLRQDRRVDQPHHVVEASQVRRLNHSLDASTLGNDLGGSLVVPAVKIGTRERYACVVLVEPSLVVVARTPPALDDRGRNPCLLRFRRGLLFRPLTDTLLESPLIRLAPRQGSLASPKLLPSLPKLPCHVWPLEEAAKRGVRDVVVRRELPQGLVSRPAPDEVRVRNELTESTLTLHR